jgi:hypothetical protein
MLGILIILFFILFYSNQNKCTNIDNNSSEKVLSLSIFDYTKAMIKFFTIIGIGVLLAVALTIVLFMLLVGPMIYFS